MEKRVLGIDFGDVRIGLAVSDPLRIIAQGITAFLNNASAIDEIAGVIRNYDIGLIVVGMPFTLKGEKGKKADDVDRFIRRLKETIPVEIVTWDERFTSRMAHRTLVDMGSKKKDRRTNKGKVDEIASALILQSYLDYSSKNL